VVVPGASFPAPEDLASMLAIIRVARLCLTAAYALSVMGCARALASAKADGSVAPVIERVVPAAGPAGVSYPLRVTIEGRHFADSANTVTFGPVALKGLQSSEGGTRIVLFLPKETPAMGEVPPAVLQPGTYRITVTTGAGESNAVAFQLTPEPGAIR
jgi:hypothetical protein